MNTEASPVPKDTVRSHPLEWGVDDPDDLDTRTVSAPGSPRSTTEWITIDRDGAVPSTAWD